jgi:dGTPase
VQEIRDLGAPLISFSEPLFQELKLVRAFLFTRMYRAPSVIIEREKVTRVINDLFPLFIQNPNLLPQEWRNDVVLAKDEAALARVVADYVSGMTDRFALQEHKRLNPVVK